MQKKKKKKTLTPKPKLTEKSSFCPFPSSSSATIFHIASSFGAVSSIERINFVILTVEDNGDR